MDLTFDEHELAFRDEFRAFLSEHRPTLPEGRGLGVPFAWRRDWQRVLHTGGWVAPDWPSEYGGRDATVTQTAIYYEELGRAGLPVNANVIGTALFGPTAMVWGTDEQKQRFLEPVLTAEEIWCQGFSEPGAGSDLAGVSTRAVRRGDEWELTGQKVWTSYAQYAKWCMVLARSEAGSSRHKGLSFFLMDMEQEGVQVRPLKQITGGADFNELFLEGARVPHEHMLGPEGSGWKVALTTLMNERSGLGMLLLTQLRHFVDDLFAAARESGAIEDPRVADALGDLHLRCEVNRLMAWKGLTDTERYGQPGPEGSLIKLLWSESNQLASQIAVDIMGLDALVPDSRWAYELLRSRGNTIEGGTSEILRNIVAERVLGLPRLARVA